MTTTSLKLHVFDHHYSSALDGRDMFVLLCGFLGYDEGLVFYVDHCPSRVNVVPDIDIACMC